MTGSLRLSALLLLLLSRWASADLEKGEDEYVRSWVIIEEQLVPPSRDEPLATGGVGTAVGGGGGAGRRITPKSVFVAPSFNKCSDGYRPDSMGRCVKVVKINQAAQWDFLLKQLNSMYGPGAGGVGFPVMPGASAYRPAAVQATTTTVEPPAQKTDSPGPFQLNIPLGGSGVGDADLYNQTMDTVDELTTGTTTTAGTTGTTTTAGTTTTSSPTTTSTGVTGSTTVADEEDATTDHPVTTSVDDPDDHTSATVTTTDIMTEMVDTARPRPYRNRFQTTVQAEDATVTVTPPSYDSTTTVTYAKTKYADSSKTTSTTTAGTEDPPQTIKTTAGALPSSSFPSPVDTSTAVDVTDMDNPATAATPLETEEEDVVTVLAVAAAAVDGHSGSSKPVVTTRLPYTTSGKTQPPVTDTVTPEYYDDQPEEPTPSPEPDCSAPNAYQYYAVCASFRQQEQLQQLQQHQKLLQQHQQQQQLYQQQQQQFYNQQQPQYDHMATALVKRPIASGGVQVRFPGDEDPASATVADSANLIRFPGPAPYRTTNKMYESSRHPTWWPTGWPDQQQQQQPIDSVQQQHRLQHHLPQQKQDVRLWEFGSRLPKITSTTTPVPPPPTQWYHRFF